MPILLYMGLLLLFCIFIILLGIYSWKQGTLSYLIFFIVIFIVIMYIIMHIVFFLIFLWNVVVPDIFKKFKSLKKKILKKFSFIKRKYLGTKNGGGLISKKDQRDILSIMYLVFILLFVYISYIMENEYASEIFFYYVITIFFVLLYCFWQ